MALKEINAWAAEIVARSQRRFPSLELAYWELFSERLKTGEAITAALRDAEEERGAPWVMVGFDERNWFLGETSFEVPKGPDGKYSTLTFEEAKAAAQALGGRLMTWGEADFASPKPDFVSSSDGETFYMHRTSGKAWSVDSRGVVSFFHYDRFGTAQKCDLVPGEKHGFRLVIELSKPSDAISLATIKAGEDFVRQKEKEARNYVQANSGATAAREAIGSVAGVGSVLARLGTWFFRNGGEA